MPIAKLFMDALKSNVAGLYGQISVALSIKFQSCVRISRLLEQKVQLVLFMKK